MVSYNDVDSISEMTTQQRCLFGDFLDTASEESNTSSQKQNVKTAASMSCTHQDQDQELSTLAVKALRNLGTLQRRNSCPD